jgi:hypothetical protein
MYRPSSSDPIDMSSKSSVPNDGQTVSSESTESESSADARSGAEGGAVEARAAEASVSAVATAEPAESTQPEPVSTADPAAIGTPGHAGVIVDFKHELIRAMRSAAELERERVEAAVATSIDAHLQKVRTRAATEAEELRHLADADIDGIHDWSKAETTRIQEEADRRIGARRRQLEHHIEQHASITEREVGSIESAVTSYRSELERYFARLADEQDPAELARQATLLPSAPDLEQVGGNARAQAVDTFAAQPETTPPAAVVAQDRESAFSPTQAGPTLVPVMADEDDAAAEEPVPVPVFAGEPGESTASSGASGTEDDDVHAESNGTLQRLRSLAGLGPSNRRQD